MTFAEELILLALDPDTGKFQPLPRKSLELSLAGALLLEMAFHGIIDTEPGTVVVLEESVRRSQFLDAALQTIREGSDRIPLRQALARLGLQGNMLIGRTLRRLVDQGILSQKADSFLWIKRPMRHPLADGELYDNVVDRIRALALDPEEIPSPHEVVLVALGEACKLHRFLFSVQEYAQCRERLKAIAAMDFVGQAIIEAVSSIGERSLLELAAGEEP
ncbi:GPP34 family phosphoprotein [Ruficoccus amylovorans]|uniref:GPP34 family phosphoprotein n=1 Tax=Ruficoccus amylovorans TaxID=1804625 RepID=A0A842HD33_9BACT|nr:GPP34 family phosphoprotein [Ruficoccus amylovorans]MBC2594403.1 GPP34 family phosphoprotein [Ruficoccus amylovorans]